MIESRKEQHPISVLINFGHAFDLLSLLNCVLLVDAKLIDILLTHNCALLAHDSSCAGEEGSRRLVRI